MELSQSISSRPRAFRVHGTLAVVLAVLLIGTAAVRWLGGTYAQLIFTFAVVGVGASLARQNVSTSPRFPLTTCITLAIVVVWEVCSLSLIWTSLRSELFVWRVSWCAIIVVLGLTHCLALRIVASRQSGTVERMAIASAATLTLMLVYPAVSVRFPSLPGATYFWGVALSATGTVFGSMAVWRRRANSGRSITDASYPAGARWISLSHPALVVVGLCLGRATAPQRATLDLRPSSLADLTPNALTQQLDGDLERFKILDWEVTDLVEQMESLKRKTDAKLQAEQRDHYLPHEGVAMRSHFRKFLAYRASLLGIVARYAGLDDVSDPRMRARCFTLGLAAAMKTYESSVKIVLMYRAPMLSQRTLNESQKQYGVDDGMFDWVYESVISERNVGLATRMAARFTRRRREWRDMRVWPTSDWNWLDTRIVAASDYVKKHPIDRPSATAELLLRRLGDQAYAPLYDVQSSLVTWMGDTRLVDRPPAIQPQQIKEIESKLRPGDILVQRREWSVGNAFLPGFWSHAALYVGRIEDLRRLGLADHATVRAHLADYLAPTSDGNDRTVIEAISEGVVFRSLADSLHCDHVAVFRPNLSEPQIAQAIAKAIQYHGRPYDFEFDFATADKLVCTELVYRAFQGMLSFDLAAIMGRNTMPADRIVGKFVRERNHPHRELDLLLYYQTPLAATSAQRGTEQALVATVAPPIQARRASTDESLQPEFGDGHDRQAD